jgi:hypothetical protein
VDVIHRFPMTFGDEDSSYSTFNVAVPTLLYFGQDQMRHNYVDGWGTLYLPADTFQVLRVRSVLQRTDTVFIEQFGFGFRIPEPETVEYKWLAPGMGEPVLQVITTGGIPISARFFYEPEEVTTSVDPVGGTNELLLYPNPATNEAFLQVAEGQTGRLLVHDALGREVHSAMVRSGSLHRIALDGLAVGTYRVQLLGTDSSWSTTLVVRP